MEYAARKEELRNMVETTQSQIEGLTLEKSSFQERATTAEEKALHLAEEVQRLAHFEGEVKEKTLLIGKLRHEGKFMSNRSLSIPCN
jgi:predicted  nucleic acid-binding Zn-ribbon protein